MPGDCFPRVEFRSEADGDSYVAWEPHNMGISNWAGFRQTCQRKHFSELGLPGVEIVPRPCRCILHPTRASHLPYSAKSDFSLKFYIYLIFLLFIPLKGPIGPGGPREIW